jgi:cytochrome c oxidase subunit II
VTPWSAAHGHGYNPHMTNKSLLTLAVTLASTGIVGLSVTWVLLSPSASPVASPLVLPPGQQIYLTGASANGPIPRSVPAGGMMSQGRMGDMSCVDCHGEDGRGGQRAMMFGGVEIPDIRYSVLSSPRSEDSTTEPGWTDRDIARAIRDGIEPNGEQLKAPMPRWDMTDAEVDDVIAYLKELDRR